MEGYSIRDMIDSGTVCSCRPPCPLCNKPSLLGWLEHKNETLYSTCCYYCGAHVFLVKSNYIVMKAYKDGKLRYNRGGE